MESFKNMQEMARKNPDLNPRVTAYQQIIDKGYDTDDYFFTFTNIKKVGINPTSQHDTPNGVYTFPASEILPTVHGDMKNVPYVGDAPYIHVLKKKGKGIVDPLESYSKSDYTRDINKLYRMITNSKHKSLPMNVDGQAYVSEIITEGKKTSRSNTPISWFWNTTKLISGDIHIASLMGWGGVKSGKYKQWYTEEERWDKEEGILNRIKNKKRRRPRSKRIGVVWNRKGVSSNAQGWNNLLRQLGYNAFVDRSGSEVIHPNEPIQAVFLTPKAYTVVDMIENKSYEVLNRKDDLDDGIETLEKKHNKVSIVGSMSKQDLNRFLRLVKGDIRGCSIEYHKGVFHISGGGEISDFVFDGDTTRLDGITIGSGDYISMKYIKDCVILGGAFRNCKLDSCEVLNGDYTECTFPNVTVINNSNLDNCRSLVNHAIFSCDLEVCRVTDCSFTGNCKIRNTKIEGKNGSIILDDKRVRYSDVDIDNANINFGIFDDFIIEGSRIKGGIFSNGMIQYCIIQDGSFVNTKIRLTDIQGGDIK